MDKGERADANAPKATRLVLKPSGSNAAAHLFFVILILCIFFVAIRTSGNADPRTWELDALLAGLGALYFLLRSTILFLLGILGQRGFIFGANGILIRGGPLVPFSAIRRIEWQTNYSKGRLSVSPPLKSELMEITYSAAHLEGPSHRFPLNIIRGFPSALNSQGKILIPDMDYGVPLSKLDRVLRDNAAAAGETVPEIKAVTRHHTHSY